MIIRWLHWRNNLLLTIFLMAIVGCVSKAPLADVPISSPSGLNPNVLALSCPPARAMSEEAVRSLPDHSARDILLRDHQEGESPRFEISFRGPRLVAASPASMTLEGVDLITLPRDSLLVGYLDMRATVKEKSQHDFAVLLFVDGRQTAFELSGCKSLAHVVSLPAWKPQTFEFRLPELLSPGNHELLWLVHDDPDNTYANAGVEGKKQKGGKIPFATAAQRPFSYPVAIRQFVRVAGGANTCPPSTWSPETLEPRQTDLLNTPLLISLTDDETDPLMSTEPAIIWGSGDPLYAFIRSPVTTTAIMIAILDNQQVSINGQLMLRFEVHQDRYYQIPLHIEWPVDVQRDRIHQLYVGVAFDACFEWEQRDLREASVSSLPAFAPPVMIVPDESWISWMR